MSRILVLDYGSQFTQLIARRVREANVYSEIVPHTITAAELAGRRPKGVIFSGGPMSVHVEGAPSIDRILNFACSTSIRPQQGLPR